jgi:hypothetical protein
MRYEKHITRQMLRDNPETLFVFGDNLLQAGYGGQAKEMRGESNAVGIPTKHRPDMADDAFFTNNDYGKVVPIISDIFDRLFYHVGEGGEVVWPEDGIGTGLAQLKQRAPDIWEYIEEEKRDLEKVSCK